MILLTVKKYEGIDRAVFPNQNIFDRLYFEFATATIKLSVIAL